MKKLILSFAAIVILLFAGAIACTSSTAEERTTDMAYDDELITHGEYLVTIIGCDDCHSPKKMGPQGPEIIPELRFSGYQANNPVMQPDTGAMKKGWHLFGPDLTIAAGPWGTSFAANITSDGTGIGNWKEEQFFRAMREGKYKGLENSRPMMPPMPWPNFSKMSDRDLKAIFAFLKSTKPVNNVVPAFMPPAGAPPEKKS